MSREEVYEPKKYYTIISGKFRVQVDKDDPTAVQRDWKSADGTKSGTKYERIVNSLFGYITDISFFDGEYGTQLCIKLDFNQGEAAPIVALNMASREAESFVKRLPNIDLAKEVRLRPYSFEKEGDDVRGLEVMQPDDKGEFTIKVSNFFYASEKLEDGSTKREYLNGFPEPEGDTESYSKDDWKLYFLQCRKFLISYTKENICPKFRQLPQRTPHSLEEQDAAYPKEEINPDDIPF